jgi:hypothetical protein
VGYNVFFGQFSNVAKVAIIHKKIHTRGVKCGGPLLCTLFFLLFMNEKKGVQWEGALSPYSALLQIAQESKGIVNCEGTKRAGKKLWHVTLVVHSSRKLA